MDASSPAPHAASSAANRQGESPPSTQVPVSPLRTPPPVSSTQRTAYSTARTRYSYSPSPVAASPPGQSWYHVSPETPAQVTKQGQATEEAEEEEEVPRVVSPPSAGTEWYQDPELMFLGEHLIAVGQRAVLDRVYKPRRTYRLPFAPAPPPPPQSLTSRETQSAPPFAGGSGAGRPQSARRAQVVAQATHGRNGRGRGRPHSARPATACARSLFGGGGVMRQFGEWRIRNNPLHARMAMPAYDGDEA